ncbi:MAG TPA: cytochrome P450 [Roseiarcus sp.]|nr:cytochrome P450 [Roseiarcus sp.]
MQDPYPAYRRLRDLGPAVWMPKRKMWAISRFEDVRIALRAADVLVSGKGVAANKFMNRQVAPITLTSDGEIHDRRRNVLIQPVMPTPLKASRARLEDEAERKIAALATGETFDAMSKFASHLPVTVVAELVGLNEAGRARMLDWAAATFNALGAMNLRGVISLPKMMQLRRYVLGLGPSTVVPGGWASRLFEAADRKELSLQEAKAMVIDYVAPALDTTILATGHMVWLLATTQGAYEEVRSDPGLIPGVVNEAVRMASPIRGFTRYASADFPLGSSLIPRDSRVLILYASANRDERRYADPDRFDVRRNPRDHVGWGHGPHACVGMHLARLEMEILLKALVDHVETIEVGAPAPAWNNVLQGFKTLPARFHGRRY